MSVLGPGSGQQLVELFERDFYTMSNVRRDLRIDAPKEIMRGRERGKSN